MKRALLATLVATTLSTGPGFAQTAAPATPAEQPIPVPQQAPKGSSGAGSDAVGSLASGGLALVGLVVVLLVAGGVAIANSN
ncbi:MAG: hypothetical protein U1E59_01160 [Amaricoccus sp.]